MSKRLSGVSSRSLIVPQIAFYLGFGIFWMRSFSFDVLSNRSDLATDITGLAAVSVVMAASVIVVCLLLQRSFVRGLLSGGVKR